MNPDDGEDDGLEKKPMVKEEPIIIVQAIILPEISDPSLLLKEQSRRSLYTSLPALVQGRKWVMLYRSDTTHTFIVCFSSSIAVMCV